MRILSIGLVLASLLSSFCSGAPAASQQGASQVTSPEAGVALDTVPVTLKDLCSRYPSLVEGLFANLNLDYPGLQKVKAAVAAKQWPEACQELVDYYRRKSADHYSWLHRKQKASSASIARAGDVLKNTFTFQEVTGTQHTRPGGGLDWTYKGPRQDVEWAYFLNRQGYFNDLLGAYQASGDRRYADKLNALAGDWVLANPLPPKKTSIPTWRELEVGLRLTSGNWPRTFYGFIDTKAFSPVVCILMLSSVPEQAGYIYHYHRMHSNWAAMELNGLASASVYWPEFREADAWFDHAAAKMLEEQRFEVYPGGVQNELTSHYHEVSMSNFAQFVQLSERSGRKVPEEFTRTVEKMYGYVAMTIRPIGYGLLNNDADLDYNRPVVEQAAKTYGRTDWAYIASQGSRGTKPTALSKFFPWAGQLIMRSGWKAKDQWAFFDAGPWGNGHQHNDMLHLSVAALGHDWLVDGGRYYYKWDEWRSYFVSSAAHNVVLVDGAGQQPTAKLASHPREKGFSCQPRFDFCMGTYAGGFSRGNPRSGAAGNAVIGASHTRAVVYVRGKYWVVFDHLSSVGGHRVEPLWHFAPQCKVTVSSQVVTARDSAGASLQVVPADPAAWQTSIVRGRGMPDIQGWYSRTYNEKVPNDCVVYQRKAQDSALTFAWVIYPASQGTPHVQLTSLEAPDGAARVRVAVPGLPAAEIAVRFYGMGPVVMADGRSLEGDCAIVEQGLPPLVSGGALFDKAHHELVHHD